MYAVVQELLQSTSGDIQIATISAVGRMLLHAAHACETQRCTELLLHLLIRAYIGNAPTYWMTCPTFCYQNQPL